MKLNLLIAVFCALFCLYGCKKGGISNGGVEPPNPELSLGNVAISGNIKNPDGSDAEGVEVIVDGHKLITPASGFFEYTGKVSDPDKVVLSIYKNGYFKYIKTLTLEENSSIAGLSYLLAKEDAAGSLESAAGGTIANLYATLIFQPNSFATANGSIYNGRVSVTMPNDILWDYENKLPGDSRALSAANEKVVVERWGGMNVRAYTSTGQPLKLVKPAEYKYKIDWRYVYIYNNKKVKMKLWSYNEADDLWQEAGGVTMEGQYFSGSISDLRYLQWGIPFPQALLRAKVTDAKLNPASYCKFGAGLDEFNGAGLSGVKINSKGVALMYIPAGISVRVYALTPCNYNLGVYLLNPIGTDSKVEQSFGVDLAPYQTIFEGKIEDCDFKGVKGKAVYTFAGRKMVDTLDNGNFKFSFIHCTGGDVNGQLVIYDEQNKIIHQNNNYVIRAGSVNEYAASLCDKKQTGKLTVVVEGKTYTFQTPEDNVSFVDLYDNSGNLNTAILANSESRKESFYLTYAGHTGGNVTINTFAFSLPSSNYQMLWGYYAPGVVSVTTYKTGSKLAEGTFTTKASRNFAQNGVNDLVDVTGSFSVSR